MSTLNVRIERLPAMRVAQTKAMSENAEHASIQKILTWATSRGMAADYRLFGYDNCQPHPNHIYTTWLTVEPGVEGDNDIDILEFPGGLFAVTRVTGVEKISSTWQALVAWAEKHHYRIGSQPGLEELVNPTTTPDDQAQIDLYLSMAD